MTQISPRATGDFAAHFARMSTRENHARLATLASHLTLAIAALALATLSGWALATAQDLCTEPEPAALIRW